MNDFAIDTDFEVKERYPFTCCSCGHEQSARPSIFMTMMMLNEGGGTCLSCGVYLMLEIGEDGRGDCMISSLMSDAVA